LPRTSTPAAGLRNSPCAQLQPRVDLIRGSKSLKPATGSTGPPPGSPAPLSHRGHGVVEVVEGLMPDSEPWRTVNFHLERELASITI